MRTGIRHRTVLALGLMLVALVAACGNTLPAVEFSLDLLAKSQTRSVLGEGSPMTGQRIGVAAMVHGRCPDPILREAFERVDSIRLSVRGGKGWRAVERRTMGGKRSYVASSGHTASL